MAELDFNEISTPGQLSEFLRELSGELNSNPGAHENRTSESMLEAAAAWVEDMDGYFLNNSIPRPESVDWSFIALLFRAALSYE
ncbi:DUF7660 family protein [Nocardia mangyaensis]|uniref:DUF7660 family protein n=1 Tax=Nocardia mangyaensis TaxID=2213200 RepID=UPI002674BA26|nr:hypothetical protein [Nocardia mangyaensis]MDO3648980.1 hypothetical protein [Nocardia mangyaensis]